MAGQKPSVTIHTGDAICITREAQEVWVARAGDGGPVIRNDFELKDLIERLGVQYPNEAFVILAGRPK